MYMAGVMVARRFGMPTTKSTARASGSPASITLALTLVIALPAIVAAMTLLLVWRGNADLRRSTDERLISATGAVAAQMRATIGGALGLLEQVDGDLGPDPAAFTSRRASDTAFGDYVLVTDAAGELKTGDLPGLASANLANNPFFLDLANNRDWYVSPLFTVGATGSKAFAVGRSLHRDGRFAGVALVFVPAGILADQWITAGLGPNSAIGVIRDDGWLVTRYPTPDATTNLSDHELFTEHLKASPTGIYRGATSPVDQQQRTVGYAKLDDLPLVVTASIAKSVIATSYWRGIWSTASITAPAGLALVLVCIWMTILLRREQRSSQALAAALDQNQLLFQETHHRIKNNLQTVIAMISLQPISSEHKQSLTGRILAMAAVHQHMYESGLFDDLDIKSYVDKLAESLRLSHASNVEITTDIVPIQMPADRALWLGLIINEVVTNAYKHGFPDGRSGEINIRLAPTDDGRARLTIRDTGVGYASDPHIGMGSQLIESLTGQLGGRATRTSNGGAEFDLVFVIAGDDV
jgi:two-component system, sensor histidine kinase PdtaS